ncbi:MAG: site-specific integrase [Planctomycetes bacterium]|nr:site-specific integrase [Planctomycetota bacterium]
MASLVWKEKSKSWQVVFYDPNGHQWWKKTGKANKKDAMRDKARVEEALTMMEAGLLSRNPPDGIHIKDWIFSCGEATPIEETLSLADACQRYQSEVSDNAKDTKEGEAVHVRHLCRVLGGKTLLRSLTLRDMKAYADNRRTKPLKVKGRTYPTASDKTIKYELLTFTKVWQWARRNNFVTSTCPVKDVANPRQYAVPLAINEDREQLTWDEIELRIKKERIPADKQRELWAGLYLNADEMTELLNYCRDNKRYAAIVPAIFLAACAGMRQAEIQRARTTDVDLKSGFITVRQRKSTKPTRQVPISDTLRAYLVEYLKGREEVYLVTVKDKALTGSTAPYYFDMLFKGSKWENKLCGYHRLRHSFGSIALSNGGTRDVIGSLMGHSTEEMKSLYQKVYPCDKAKAATFLP